MHKRSPSFIQYDSLGHAKMLRAAWEDLIGLNEEYVCAGPLVYIYIYICIYVDSPLLVYIFVVSTFINIIAYYTHIMAYTAFI